MFLTATLDFAVNFFLQLKMTFFMINVLGYHTVHVHQKNTSKHLKIFSHQFYSPASRKMKFTADGGNFKGKMKGKTSSKHMFSNFQLNSLGNEIPHFIL